MLTRLVHADTGRVLEQCMEVPDDFRPPAAGDIGHYVVVGVQERWWPPHEYASYDLLVRPRR